MRILPCLALASLLHLPALADFHHVQAQKKTVDIESLLVPDRENIICFFSTSTPICRALYPELQKLGAGPKVDVHVVDIATVNSPTAKKYQIRSVPYFKIYDKEGNLTQEGSDAYREVTGRVQKQR